MPAPRATTKAKKKTTKTTKKTKAVKLEHRGSRAREIDAPSVRTLIDRYRGLKAEDDAAKIAVVMELGSRADSSREAASFILARVRDRAERNLVRIECMKQLFPRVAPPTTLTTLIRVLKDESDDSIVRCHAVNTATFFRMPALLRALCTVALRASDDWFVRDAVIATINTEFENTPAGLVVVERLLSDARYGVDAFATMKHWRRRRQTRPFDDGTSPGFEKPSPALVDKAAAMLAEVSAPTNATRKRRAH